MEDLILTAKDYRSFLTRLFERRKERNSHFSYSAFAQEAGFSSKSFLKDVLAQRKRLTERSLPKVIKGFKLKGDAAKFLSLLVLIEESPEIDHRHNREKLQKIKARARSKRTQKRLPKPSPAALHWREVFAAMGSKEQGASLKEIVSRTGIRPATCQSSLDFLLEAEAISYNKKTQKYHVSERHLIFSKIDPEQHSSLNYYTKNMERFKKSAQQNFNSDERLFLTSAFSIHPEQLEELKERLREVIWEFVDQSEKPQGSRVAHLALGFGLLDL